MKTGDQLVVSMGGFEVAMATIEEVADGKAIISIPATRVVMGVKTSLTDLTPEVEQNLLGAVREDGSDLSSAASDAQIAAAQTSSPTPPPAETQSVPQSPAEPAGSLREMKLDSSALD